MSAQLAVNFLIESEIIKRAAYLRNLTLKSKLSERCFFPEFDSEAVGTFKLDKDFLSALEKHGFTFGHGTIPPHNEMLYLAGHSNQRGAETFESDCWAWKKTETDYQLTIYFHLSIEERKRGIMCIPHVWGNCSSGALHRPTINKLVRVVAEYFPESHPLIREVKTSVDSLPVILWHNIGLGGIKSVGTLFNELYERNEKVKKLASSNLSPFDPSPDPKEPILKVRDRLFVEEIHQPALFKQWKEQLQAFQSSLM